MPIQDSQVPVASDRTNDSYEPTREHSPPPPPSALSALQTSANPFSENPTSAPRVPPPESGFAKRFVYDVSIVTESTLADLDRLQAWYEYDLKRRDTICKRSEEFWANVQSAAVKARSAACVNDPVGFFKWLVKGENWSFLRGSDDDLAAAMRCEVGRQSGLAKFLAESWKVPA